MLVVWHTIAPPAEDPNYVSLTQVKLGLVPTLWQGQDVQGFPTEHQMMTTVHPTKVLPGQPQQEKQQVDGPCLHPWSAP